MKASYVAKMTGMSFGAGGLFGALMGVIDKNFAIGGFIGAALTILFWMIVPGEKK